MISKLVVAYDGSPESKKAFDFGLSIAAKFEAELVVCSVATLPEPPVDVEVSAILEHATEFYKSRFTSLAAKGAAANVSIRFEIKAGHPAEQITLLAREEGAQMIVVGHRGHTLLQKWMIGSVCKRIINFAHCTVSVVRNEQAKT